VLLLGVVLEAQKTHTILVMTMVLRWLEIVGQISTGCRVAGVGMEGGANVAGVASWKCGVQEWV